MEKNVEQVMTGLFSFFELPYNLKSIIRTFKDCSYDKGNKRYLVENQVKTIDFDNMTKWLYKGNVPSSADCLSFADKYVYLIEFKSGDQTITNTKFRKLLEGVQKKIDDSDASLYNKVYPGVGLSEAEYPKIRFFTVVDSKAMGANELARQYAKISGILESDDLVRDILPQWNENTVNRAHFDIIDIWESDYFDTYIEEYNISDIVKPEKKE